MHWLIDHWVDITALINLISVGFATYLVLKYRKLCKELDSAIEETREIYNIYKMALEKEKNK